MTVGEKIQFYRKKNGLSQDDLGQKLFVSRQTVSLWEMDKTMPTVENLIRLKEIFAVSVDEILNDSEIIDIIDPKETYTFTYREEDMQALFRKESVPYVKRGIIFPIACIVLFMLLACTAAPDVILGLVLGYFLLGVMYHLKGYFAYKKVWKDTARRILQCTYSYEIFDNYFILKVIRNEEVVKTHKHYFEDIEAYHILGNYLVLRISGQSCIIKKDALHPDSAFIARCNQLTDKVDAKKPKAILNIISILLFVLSICTIGGALAGVAILSGINQVMTENMWIFFCFLPVPIASVAFGYYLKHKGYRYKKNVIVGIVMAVLLCIYGSFTFIFSGIYSHSDAPILSAEQQLDIDIPQHSQINTQDWTQGTQSIPRGYIISVSDIYFEASAVEEFEKALSQNAKWITRIPGDLVCITSYFCDVHTSDYYIIYNKDTGEFNKLPDESGMYIFLNVMYNAENNTMKLVEYQIEYNP